ncbi:MAG: flagellar basal body P-ring formation chaperone FlgA [Deltaproteobacteria bacterium]
MSNAIVIDPSTDDGGRRWTGSWRMAVCTVLFVCAVFFGLAAPEASETPPSAAAQRSGEGSIVLTAEDFSQVFSDTVTAMGPWDGEVEITGLRISPPTVTVPEGTLGMDVPNPPQGRGLGTVSFPVRILVDGVLTKTVRVTGRVEVYRSVACAVRHMKKDHVIGPGDVAVVRKPLSQIQAAAVSALEEVLGKRLTSSVRAGAVLTERMLSEAPVVSKGDRVTIIADSPVLRVSVPGVILEDGARGEYVQVKNLMSGKEVFARVEDASTVSVAF